MPGRETHTLTLTPGMALSLARQFLRGVDGHLPDNARETLALLVTELASNAIIHGEPPAELQVTWLAGTARLVVRSGGPPFRWRGPPSPARAPEGGLGLVLVDRLADRWGIRRSDSGNEVWLELDQ
jgi:anti-sigma regulatory factor (Ser/Thr protein kinase)